MQDLDDSFILVKDNDPFHDHGLTYVMHGDSHEDKGIKNNNTSIEVACIDSSIMSLCTTLAYSTSALILDYNVYTL